MRSSTRGIVPAAVLVPLFFIPGFSSEATAMVDKLTICHLDGTTGKTLKLPSHLAQRHLSTHPNDFTGECGGTKFVIVAVSGTLEEGFALRPNLDFLTEVNEGNPPVLGIFLGKALVRGVRAYLDIKEPGSREFRDLPAVNPINPGLVASGNDKDGNISSIYLVDRRQAARALLNEPRLLSMVPDLGKVDINALETSSDLKKLLRQAIQEDTTLLGPKNMDQVTFLQVISTWKSCHFVPSPVLYTNGDGVRVTDFPNSLAKFANTTAEIASVQYFADVDKKVRETLTNSDQTAEGAAGCTDNPFSFPIPPTGDLTKYAVDKHTKRMNQAYRPCEFEEFARRAGVNIHVPQCPN